MMKSTTQQPINNTPVTVGYAAVEDRSLNTAPNETSNSPRCFFITTGFLFLLSVVFLVIAAILPMGVHNLVEKQLRKQIPLNATDSMTYPVWLSPPIPIYMQFWFFHVINPAEVIQKGAKPFLRQVGPITYLEKRQKVDIIFHSHNSSVSYRELRTYHYVEEMSVLKEDDNFTNINIPMLVFGDKVRYYGGRLHGALEIIFKAIDQNGLFITKSAKEILWGYEDPALKLAQRLLSPFGIVIDPMVGIFYGKNGSDDGRYNVFTGSASLNNFLHLHTWNDATELNYWSTKAANQLNGTDGTMFAPGVHRDSRLYIFTSDLCRSTYVEYMEPSTVRGVPVLVFTAPDSVTADAKDNPANGGFCIPKCLPAGLLNMTTCQPQAPVVTSPPHFYKSAPELLRMVDGLEPSDDYRIEVAVEPTTGIVLRAQKKGQVNMVVERVNGFPSMNNLPHLMYLPLFWINESAVVDEADADRLRSSVVLVSSLETAFQVAFYVIGGFLLAVVIVLIAVVLFQRRRLNDMSKWNLLKNEVL